MAWASAHFATGMVCGGAMGCTCTLLMRGRGGRWIVPLTMTLGGLWAMVPDMPRLFRVDFPSLGLASTLGAKDLERWLHQWGNVFFFHRDLDAQPREFALHGLFLIVLLYNAVIFGQWWIDRRSRTRSMRRLTIDAGDVRHAAEPRGFQKRCDRAPKGADLRTFTSPRSGKSSGASRSGNSEDCM